MQITIIFLNLVLAILLKFMPNISILARIFTKVTATLEIWTQIDCFIGICDCSIRVTQSFVLFLRLNCFSGIQTYTLHQLYIDLIHLI